MRLIITGGNILGENMIKDHAIIIENDAIYDILPECMLKIEENDLVIKADGNFIAPGFIELHTHGIEGYDFMDNDPDGLKKALYAYAKHGVTGLYPTTLSCAMDELISLLNGFTQIDFNNTGGASVLGLHLEGPYLCKEQCGAQSGMHLKSPCFDEYSRIIEQNPFVQRWDLAPELEGAQRMSKYLSEKGIIAAIAHTNADAPQILKAAENGFTLVTHLYSGMTTVHRKNGFRHGGGVEGCLLCDGLAVELILDGIHVPKELIQLTFKIKGVNNICLVTDSTRAAGLKNGGEFILGNKNSGIKALIGDHVAWLPDKSAFAGSLAVFDRLIYNAVTVGGIPVEEAVQMATQTPARVMGLKNKGKLQKGFDADVVIFDEDINIQYTIIGGKIIYESGPIKNNNAAKGV